MLVSLTALGTVAGLLGVGGVFAAGSDRATTGQNDARSGDIEATPQAVNLELASATFDLATGAFNCNGDWSDDLTSGVILSDGSDLSTQFPGYPNYDIGFFCVRNVGAVAATVTATAITVVDTEVACSPGEASADASCGSGLGELSSELRTGLLPAVDGTQDPNNCGPAPGRSIAALASGESLPVGTLAPGQVQGLCALVDWNRTAASQSDRVTWRYALDGTESP